jgi:hypothetical protein
MPRTPNMSYEHYCHICQKFLADDDEIYPYEGYLFCSECYIQIENYTENDKVDSEIKEGEIWDDK